MNFGDSDCILINTAGRIILVDTSFYTSFSTINKILQNYDKIDALILTHFDYDHVGSATKLINTKKIKRAYIPKNVPKSANSKYKSIYNTLKNNNTDIIKVKSSCFLKFGNTTITILPPKSDFYFFDNSNNSSLVLVVKHFNNSVFLAADICEDRANEMLESNEIEHYNILKVPHHGINFKNSEELYTKIKPEVSVITCSSFRHLRIVKDNSLKNCGNLYFTDTGSVILQMYKNGYSVNQL